MLPPASPAPGEGVAVPATPHLLCLWADGLQGARPGKNRVAANVVTTAIWEASPVRQMVTTSPGRSEPMAAKMRMAPSVGMATLATSPEKRARITSIHMPDEIAAQRVRPPALTFSAVWPTSSSPRPGRHGPAAGQVLLTSLLNAGPPLRRPPLVRRLDRTAQLGAVNFPATWPDPTDDEA
jgi:hypothetical protein